MAALAFIAISAPAGSESARSASSGSCAKAALPRNGVADSARRRIRITRFVAASPNVAWVTDVTFVWTLEGWLYLAAIIDLCSRRVVGWATSATNDRELALTALHDALRRRCPRAGLLHHSDRGSPYASRDYQAACWDNAVAESFFATLKVELVDHEVYFTRASASASIGEYIDAFYNLERRHSSIGYVSPVEFELKLQSKMEAA